MFFFPFELLSCTPWSSLLCSVSKLSSILLKKCIRYICLEYPSEVLFVKGFSLLVVNLVFIVKIIKMEAKWAFSWNNVSLLLPADQFFYRVGLGTFVIYHWIFKDLFQGKLLYCSKPHCMAIFFWQFNFLFEYRQ